MSALNSINEPTPQAHMPLAPTSINEPPHTPAPPSFTVASINPTSAVIGSPDITLHVMGTGFGAQAQIVFNGGVEPTTRVSSRELTTIVKPSTASVPGSYPVTVVQGGVTVDPPQMFTFTAAAADEAATASRGRRHR